MSLIAADLNTRVPPRSMLPSSVFNKLGFCMARSCRKDRTSQLSKEFLLHGVKYAFPAEHGEVTRGVPTSFAAPR